MKPVVLGFSGRIGSGKSTLATLVADSLQVPCVSFGDYVRNVSASIGLDIADRTVLQDLGGVLVKHPKVFCANVLAQAEYQPGQTLVIDGVRHREIADELRRQVLPARFVLVYVDIDEKRIEDNLHEEGNSDQSVAELVLHSTETQIPIILAGIADIVVDNSRVRPPEEVAIELLQTLERFMSDTSVSPESLQSFIEWVNETEPLLHYDKKTETYTIPHTGIKAIEIIEEIVGLGRTVDEVVAQHPNISRAQVRAVIRQYETHRDEQDEILKARYDYSETLRRQAQPQLTREELEKRLRDRRAELSHG